MMKKKKKKKKKEKEKEEGEKFHFCTQRNKASASEFILLRFKYGVLKVKKH